MAQNEVNLLEERALRFHVLSGNAWMEENKDPSLYTDGDHLPQQRHWIGTVIKVLAVLFGLGLVAALLLPAVRYSKPAAYRNSCASKLKQIALALHTYADVYHALPPAYTVDAAGKPLHSWRTLILPYMD